MYSLLYCPTERSLHVIHKVKQLHFNICNTFHDMNIS